MVVVLPVPLTPQTMITVGPRRRRSGSAQSLLRPSARGASSFQVSRICSSVTTRPRKFVATSATICSTGVVAHVGLEEDRPHLVEERLVDQPALALEEIANVGLEQLAGLGEALLEFVEEAHGRKQSEVRGSEVRNAILVDNGRSRNGVE